MNLSALIVFLNFRFICSYFVLLTIIIFDLPLHICIFIIHALYFWHAMAGLKEKFYTLIIKFMHIKFCLLTKPQTILQLKILWHRPYFIVKLLLSLCILFIHSSFVCQVSIDMIYFSFLKFFSWSFFILNFLVIWGSVFL